MIDIVIISKDRACQLDLMLRTLYKHFKLKSNISVFYLASTPDYESGYSLLKNKYKNISLKKQINNFYDELLVLLNSLSNEYLLFLPDDVVFTGDIKEDDIQVKTFLRYSNIMNINLRVGKYLKYNYYNDTEEVLSPEIDSNGVYNWRTGRHVLWTHPMTTCCHIARRYDYISIIKNAGNSINLNCLEDFIIRNIPDKDLVVCYDYPKLVELCINIVNTTHITNIHVNTSIRMLNDKFLDNKIINDSFIENLPKEYFRFSNLNLTFNSRKKII